MSRSPDRTSAGAAPAPASYPLFALTPMVLIDQPDVAPLPSPRSSPAKGKAGVAVSAPTTAGPVKITSCLVGGTVENSYMAAMTSSSELILHASGTAVAVPVARRLAIDLVRVSESFVDRLRSH